MRTIGLILIGFILGFSAMATAQAVDAVNNIRPPFEQQLGKALPPVGFIEFCSRESTDINCLTYPPTDPSAVVMRKDNWEALNQVNQYVNTKVRPVADMELYGVPEYWSYPVEAGDCEDYVLLKKRYLVGLGLPARALAITVVLDENGDGHSVLTVSTDQGDIILDNRRKNILDWFETGYTYLTRQSSDNPKSWIALDKTKVSMK